ncbi:MAG: class I SAM-dependent methyltransferase [Steroidobacteraceae bacterium]
MHTESSARRLQPRITNSDWLVLRGMRPAIERMAVQVGRAGATAVDLGCGSQPYRPIFDARAITYRGADLDGADIRIHENGHVDLADGSADLVLSFQVLEHVRDVRQYLAEALRIVRRDGWLILSTHGTWLYHPHPEDHHRWTRQGLLAELAANGFETTECVAVVGPLGWTTMVRLTCWYQACRRIPLIGRPLAAFLALIMNARGYLEELITPDWVRRDNACVYVTLSRVNSRRSSSGRMNFS